MHRLHREKAQSFEIEFTPECHLVGSQKARAIREFNLFQPDVINDEEHIHQLSIEDIRNVATMRHPDISFVQADLSTDEARFATNAISSQAIAAEEASIGNFTWRKLKKLNTWPLWEACEHKQSNHFENLDHPRRVFESHNSSQARLL